MARAALEWDMKHLAKAAVISTNTVARFESGRNEPNPLTLKAIKAAFETGGVLFIEADETAGEGVRLAKKMKLNPEQQRQAAKNLRERASLSTKQDEKQNMLHKARLLESLASLQEKRACATTHGKA